MLVMMETGGSVAGDGVRMVLMHFHGGLSTPWMNIYGF